jgi:perosamine synthetase
MIPLSLPNISGNEWKYVKDCLDTGWISSVGAYVTQFEQMVAKQAGAKYGIAAVNGTAAIHIALELAGVEQGDYVIVPNITFIASSNAVKYTGADPIFMDVHPDTWQMDLDLLEQFLKNETYYKHNRCYLKKNDRIVKAILPVHVLGNMCDMERLMALANKHCLTVVEDSTEALGSYYKGKHAGTFGTFGTFSFNGNKIISTGGGGVIVTDDETLAKKAKHITTQAKVDPFEYDHDEIGYNYRLVNLLAAVGVAQMEQLPAFLERKIVVDARYRAEIEGLNDFRFQVVGKDVQPNNWLQTMQTKHQKALIQHLLKHDIQCRPFWVPMNKLRMFGNDIYYTVQNNAENIYQTCLSIPSSTGLTDADQSTVIQTICSFKG